MLMVRLILNVIVSCTLIMTSFIHGKANQLMTLLIVLYMSVAEVSLHHVLHEDANPLRRCLVRAAGQTEVPHVVLDDYHRAMDDHAEIECAEGEKIGWDIINDEANGGEEQGERNRQRHDNRATKIAEKEKENYRNEQHALGQVGKHRVSCQVQEVATIEERTKFYAGRGNLVVQ